jgi:glycosyltransferase involved in cell wall biosynthesis
VDSVLFSVIIPTRNRAALFAVALHSVLEQRFRDFEVIVVNDGSSEEHEHRYRELMETAPDRVTLVHLVRTQRGHGPGYASNFGAGHARGDYLCFLDDDDQWTDADHLGRIANAIVSSTEKADLFLANQRAFRSGVPVARTIWIEDLEEKLARAPDAFGAYVVTPAELLSCQAHCHLNTTIVSRDFYRKLGGFDQELRYEQDREFYLRAIDRAKVMKFLPFIVSRHNIPDTAAQTSVSTAESELSKRLYQLRVFDKVALRSTLPEMRRYAMRQRIYVLQHIAMEATHAGMCDCANYYACEALMAKLALSRLGIVGLIAGRWLIASLGRIRTVLLPKKLRAVDGH